jgi:signal recognition particle subunit SEC65
VEILQLIDKLETLISRGRRIPFTAQVILNEEELLEVIDQMRIALPEEIKAARRTQQERARIIGEAREEAERIMAEVRQKLSEMVDKHEIVEAARARATQIIQQGENDAAALRQEAYEYVLQILTDFDRRLGQIQQLVRQGISEMNSRAQRPSAQPVEEQPKD